MASQRLDQPARQGTASYPPDDAVEGGEAPAGKGQNGRRTPRIGCGVGIPLLQRMAIL